MRLGGRQARLERAVHEQAPNVLEAHLAHEILDIDAAVAQRAACLIGLGDLCGEGDYALEAGLDLAHIRQLLTRFCGPSVRILKRVRGSALAGGAGPRKGGPCRVPPRY